MRHYDSPAGDEKQIDLSGCSFALIPGTRIALVIPSPETELRLNAQLDVTARLAAIRAEARRDLAIGAEAFAQNTYAISQHLYLCVSLWTSHLHWRGGWLLFHCPPGEETAFVEYLAAARDAVVANLRKERSQYGSRN